MLPTYRKKLIRHGHPSALPSRESTKVEVEAARAEV